MELADYLELFLTRLDAVGAMLALLAAIFSAISSSYSAQYAKQVADRAEQAGQLAAWREAQRSAANTRLDTPAIREMLNEAENTWKSAAVKHSTPPSEGPGQPCASTRSKRSGWRRKGSSRVWLPSI